MNDYYYEINLINGEKINIMLPTDNIYEANEYFQSWLYVGEKFYKTKNTIFNIEHITSIHKI